MIEHIKALDKINKSLDEQSKYDDYIYNENDKVIVTYQFNKIIERDNDVILVDTNNIIELKIEKVFRPENLIFIYFQGKLDGKKEIELTGLRQDLNLMIDKLNNYKHSTSIP